MQHGLAFIVIGPRAAAPPEVAGVFDTPAWRYVHLNRRSVRGAYYADNVRYAWLLRRERVDVFHIFAARADTYGRDRLRPDDGDIS